MHSSLSSSDPIIAKNEAIAAWWDAHPFSCGAAGGSYAQHDLVGRVSKEQMTLQYFDELSRRFCKHTAGASQEPGRPVLSKLIAYAALRDKDVLDIASGSGFATVVFAAHGARVTAIDLTPFAIEETKRNLELRGLHGTVLQMDAQQLSFLDQSFDFVNAWGCLMHMPKTEQAVLEIHRVLRPGGKMLAYMYNRDSWPFWFNIIFLRGILALGFFRHGGTERLTSRYSDGYTQGGNMLTKFYTKKAVGRMFQTAGFTKVRVYPFAIAHEPDHWPVRHFPIFRHLPKQVKGWMSQWSYGLIVEAEK